MIWLILIFIIAIGISQLVANNKNQGRINDNKLHVIAEWERIKREIPDGEDAKLGETEYLLKIKYERNLIYKENLKKYLFIATPTILFFAGMMYIYTITYNNILGSLLLISFCVAAIIIRIKYVTPLTHSRSNQL